MAQCLTQLDTFWTKTAAPLTCPLMLNQSQSLAMQHHEKRDAPQKFKFPLNFLWAVCQVQKETEVKHKNSLLQRHPQEGNSPSLSLYRLRVTYFYKCLGRMPGCCSIQQPKQKLASSSSSLLAFNNVKNWRQTVTWSFLSPWFV